MSSTISVIIPAFNAARTLGETLDSVRNQTRQPHEVIVVDDGSSDGTSDVAQASGAGLPGFRVVRTENRGVSHARNTAIALATGDIVAPIDADDLWHPTYLEKVCAKLERMGPKAGFAYSFYRRIGPDSRVTNHTDDVAVDGAGFYRLLTVNYVGNGSNYVTWRSRLDAAGAFDETLVGSEDFDLQLRLAWTGLVGCIPQGLVAYRDTPGSLSKRWRTMALCGLSLARRMPDHYPGADRRTMRLIRAHGHLNFYSVIRQRRAGNVLEAIRELAFAALYDPERVAQQTVERMKLRYRNLIRRLRGESTATGCTPYRGTHFYELDPAAEWISVLPQLFQARLLESRALDEARERHLRAEPTEHSDSFAEVDP